MAGWPVLRAGAFVVTFPIYDADGDLVTAATTPDSEVSIDGGTFTDCTNEATEIATGSGVYRLSLTSGEMTGDIIATITKTVTAGAKTAVNVMYTETRQIRDLAYPTVTGRSMDVDANGGVEVGSFQTGAITAAAFTAGAIDAAAIATDAIGAAEIADGAITAATFAAGAIDATAIANGAIDAATFAAGAIDNAAFAVTETLTANPAAGGITAASFGAGAIDAAAIATGAIDADALASDAVIEIRSVASGTSDAGGSTTTMIDAARTEADTDYWAGDLIVFTSGAVAGQSRLITAFNFTTDTITFTPATTQSIGAGITYEIWPKGRSDVALWLGAAVNALQTGRVDAFVGAFASAVITSGAFAAGAIDAAAIAADAIGSSELAATAATEIADAILSRDVDQVEATAALHSLTTAILKAVSRVRDNAGTMETYRTNGTTLHMSQTVTADALLNPIDELTVGA